MHKLQKISSQLRKTIFNEKIFTTYTNNKPLRRLDTFLKASFIIGAFVFIICFFIIITSPHQFTKALVYRKDDTIVYDKDNKQIGKISQQRSEGENVLNVDYDDLNQGIINSVVGTEDAKFFGHHGFDLINTIEDGSKTLLHLGKAGGSSITQQIIGQTHVGRIGNRSIPRKIREIFLSTIGETQLSKKEILQSYLNYFEFGQGNIRGVELASNYFFNHHVNANDYLQSSILVGTLNQPSTANPLGVLTDDGYINNSQQRLEDVLLANKNQGYLTNNEYYLLQQVKIPNLVALNKKTTSNPYQDYIDVVAKEIKEKYNIDPFIQSLKIYTNMDTKAQKYANELTNKKHVYVPNDKLNFGFIVSRTQTGEIVALSGGKQYRSNGAYLFNNAIDNKQQPGSAFKPIIDYSSAFEFLHWSDRTPISNAPYNYPNTGQAVHNVDGTSGGVLTMDAALASSRNLTALRAMQAVYDKVGMNTLTEYLNRFGFNFSDTEVVPSYGIGGLSHGVTPKEMSAAYQAFGNGGYYIEPFTIRKIISEDGNETKHEDNKKQIIDERTAFLTSTTLERSTKISGAYISTAGYYASPYAAKTGTSNWGVEGAKYGIPNLAGRDSWYVGYTTEYTMSSWTGYDAKEIAQGYYLNFYDGSHDYSATLWGAMMKFLANGKEKSYLSMTLPQGIEACSFDGKTVPPLRKAWYGGIQAYCYSDNLPSGYSNNVDTSKLNISLNNSGNTIIATFANAPDEYVTHLVVGNQSDYGARSLSLAANDYDTITAYYEVGGKRYQSINKCYYASKLYDTCPAKVEEPQSETPPANVEDQTSKPETTTPEDNKE
ncbi:MAG: transglycosylase domain-containing protein [Bacilli bacterium]|jgi:penicillin-binding protein 1A|nr:transglycosylase domain-containing protein [Bacilli bacterium]